MTLPSIVMTARTMSYYQRLQEVVANNLANASSDGYKGDRMTAQQIGGSDHPVPVQTLDLHQGNLRETGRTYDLALGGDGFFVVQTPQGDRLTRGGSFSINSAGILVDRQGAPLLGVDGPLNVAGKKVTIADDGTIDVDGARAGKLRVVTADSAKLLKEGLGRFKVDGSATTAVGTGSDGTKVRQGMIEDANVDTLLGTVDMIMIQRAYASNVEALRAMDGVLGTITGEIGRVSP